MEDTGGCCVFVSEPVVETKWRTVTHGRGSEWESDEWSG